MEAIGPTDTIPQKITKLQAIKELGPLNVALRTLVAQQTVIEPKDQEAFYNPKIPFKELFTLEEILDHSPDRPVYLVTYGKKIYLVKKYTCFQSQEEEEMRTAIRETVIGVSLNHPGFLKFYAGVRKEGKQFNPYYIVMEYAEGRRLSDVVFNRDARLSSRIPLLLQVFDAYRHALVEGVVVRGLTGDNLIVGPLGKKITIVDLGNCSALDHTDGQKELLGGCPDLWKMVKTEFNIDTLRKVCDSHLKRAKEQPKMARAWADVFVTTAGLLLAEETRQSNQEKKS